MVELGKFGEIGGGSGVFIVGQAWCFASEPGNGGGGT